LPSITVFPSTGLNDSTVGNKFWINPVRISADDGSSTYLDASVSPFPPFTSYYLRAAVGSNLNSLPTNAVIDGIEITIERRESSGFNNVSDEFVRLRKSGIGYVGENKAIAVEWSTSYEVKTYGGSTDLWGTTWTREEVQSMSVGLAVDWAGSSASGTVEVDYVQFTIYYHVPIVSKSVSGVSINSSDLSKSARVFKSLLATSVNTGALATQAFVTIFKSLLGTSANTGTLTADVLKVKALSGVSTNTGVLTSLVKGGITIQVDQIKSSVFNFGLRDETGYNNILNPSPAIEYLHPDEKVKNLKVKYRKNNRENDQYLHEIERSSSTNGVDQTINLPFVYDHDTADMVLDYKRKRFAAAVKRLNIEVGQDAVNAGRGELATINIPSLAELSDWEITGTNVTPAGSQSLSLVPYSVLPYTYVPFTSEGGTLPTDASFDIAPDFSNTPPEPVTNLIVAPGFIPQTNANVGFIDVSWTPPTDGNYNGAEVSFRVNGTSTYISTGEGQTNFRIQNVEIGERYDVQVVSLNINKTQKSMPAIDLNNLIPGDTTNPNAPTALSFVRSMFGTLMWKFTFSSSTDVLEYEYQIDNASSFSTPEFTGRTKDRQIEYPAVPSGSMAATVKRWCRVRAIDKSGNFSSWTGGVSGSTGGVEQPDIEDEEVTLLGSYEADGPAGNGVTHTVTVVTRNRPISIEASWILTGAGGLILTLAQNGGSIWFGTQSSPIAQPGFNALVHRENSPGTGTRTYTLTAGNNPGMKVRRMTVTEYRNG